MNELNDLLNSLPGYALLTTAMKNTALQASRIPDSEGRWPGDASYVDTYDAYYAALTLIPFLQAQPVVTSAGSEGTTVSATPPDWAALLRYYRSMSPIVGTEGNDVLQRVAIPSAPYAKRVPMNDRGGYYGDVDTDVS